MKNLLFFSPYPEDHMLKDGMISRIKCIDDQFLDYTRTYLLISFTQKSKTNQFGNATAYILNVFSSLFKIISIVAKADIIYCQSLYSLVTMWPLIILKGKKRIILDVHGVIPEEEKFFHKRALKALYMSFVERIVFAKLDYAVCVTQAMINVYKEKYKDVRCKYLLFFITPAELINKKDTELSISKDNNIIEIIYSGGIQKWQNVDLMLKYIKANPSSNVHYTILSGNLEGVKSLINDLGIDSKNITVTSCEPSDLHFYYEKSHYAFILRDDNIVNKVANPTKLIEYLYYGLTPIVLCPAIGDYCELGYEFISVEEFDPLKLSPKKSIKNAQIARNLIASNQKFSIKNILQLD